MKAKLLIFLVLLGLLSCKKNDDPAPVSLNNEPCTNKVYPVKFINKSPDTLYISLYYETEDAPRIGRGIVNPIHGLVIWGTGACTSDSTTKKIHGSIKYGTNTRSFDFDVKPIPPDPTLLYSMTKDSIVIQ